MITLSQRIVEDEAGLLGTYFVETDHWVRLFLEGIGVVLGLEKGRIKVRYMLNRRGQTQEFFEASTPPVPLQNLGTPSPRILSSSMRAGVCMKAIVGAKASAIEEPDAGKPHVRDCVLGSRVTGVTTAKKGELYVSVHTRKTR